MSGMNLLFLYFSGTGNTDYVARYLSRTLERPALTIELRSIEWQAPEAVDDFDLLALGFPVYACEAPELVQTYLAHLPAGRGRGAWVFCTKGAFAGSAVRQNLQRLAQKGYVPLGGGSVLMPGTDGLSMIGKDSWMARKALDKDYDHLEDADRLAERMAEVLAHVLAGQPVNAFSLSLSTHPGSAIVDRLWAALYTASENWARSRLHADEGCEGCGLCTRICPVDNIALCNGRAEFGDGCALCLRCLHACPQEAIQIGGLTKDKFRWRGPKGAFRPLRMRSDGRPAT
jgi:ferredoxin